jgi:hypothetical protein
MTIGGDALYRTALRQLVMFFARLPELPETLSPEEAEARRDVLVLCRAILDEHEGNERE